MKLFCLITLLALANSSASSGYAQDDPIKVKTKGGVTIIQRQDEAYTERA